MFKKILVPIDIQKPGPAAAILKAAGNLAEQNDCVLHVMTVMPGYGMPIVASYFPADAKQSAKQELQEKLLKLVKKNIQRPASVSVEEGKRAEEILKVAKRRKMDLILIGCHKHSKLEEALLGSCGTKLAQRADCSVLVIRG
ncbi:MAG: universal stress protein F [Parasphingorhabdus sp.]|jgi:universal stress protein F